ncbi:alkaline phosphatase family protein [Dehalococcoides mccartyi]|nr:alkaline phosphatase family protein [Dehalococcoides mccartyi]
MRSQVQELLDGVNEGRWLLPTADEPNPVSLARAIAGICGAPYEGDDSVADNLRELIGEPKHLVFVIADGFGMNFVDKLDEDSFMRRNLAVDSKAVFPSSTGPNLYSLGWGQWPGQHGILGWHVHLPELNQRITPFPWIRARDAANLTDIGITGDVVYTGVPLLNQFTRDSLNLLPMDYSSSVASTAMHGAESIEGHSSLTEAIDRVLKRIDDAEHPTYTHIFWPMVDSIAHRYGTSHAKTMHELQHFDSEISRLRSSMPEDSKLVITADHGHLDYTNPGRIQIDPSDPICSLLVDSPAGDERAAMFHVIDGKKDEFVSMFSERFSEDFLLLSSEEVLELGLLGPGGMSELTEARLGDYLAISKNDTGFDFRDGPPTSNFQLKSQHGGLRPDEMRVPIVIA